MRDKRPRDLAWIPVIIFDRRSSLISSSRPSRPALKNTWEDPCYGLEIQAPAYCKDNIETNTFMHYAHSFWENGLLGNSFPDVLASEKLLFVLYRTVPLLYSTLVCPNLYWLWSISREPNSFSDPFLLSMNCPSGIAAGFRMRYLHWPYLQWSTSKL